MLAEEELLPPDPEPPNSEVPEPDVIKGLSLRMTQAMNHYQREERCCFMCRASDQEIALTGRPFVPGTGSI